MVTCHKQFPAISPRSAVPAILIQCRNRDILPKLTNRKGSIKYLKCKRLLRLSVGIAETSHGDHVYSPSFEFGDDF